MKLAVSAILLLALSIFLVNKLSVLAIPDHTSYELPHSLSMPWRAQLLPLLNFDGRNYLRIATDGYVGAGKLLAFFPGYPLLVSYLSLVFRNPIVSGLLVSAFFGLAAISLLYKYTLVLTSDQLAQKTTILFIVFPSSFFLLAYYPEGLFLTLAIGAALCLKTRRYRLGACLIGLATGVRLLGLALIPQLFWESWSYFRRTGKIPWFSLISPAGFFGYLAWLQVKFGDWRLFYYSQTHPAFGRSLSLLNPLIAFRDAAVKVLAGPLPAYDNPFIYPVIILELFWGLLAVYCLVRGWKLLDRGAWIYCFTALVLVLSSGVLSADVRELLLMFPLFIVLARIIHGRSLGLWVGLSGLLWMFSAALFLRGYWLA